MNSHYVKVLRDVPALGLKAGRIFDVPDKQMLGHFIEFLPGKDDYISEELHLRLQECVNFSDKGNKSFKPLNKEGTAYIYKTDVTFFKHPEVDLDDDPILNEYWEILSPLEALAHQSDD